jgi:hypothetical protein
MKMSKIMPQDAQNLGTGGVRMGAWGQVNPGKAAGTTLLHHLPVEKGVVKQGWTLTIQGERNSEDAAAKPRDPRHHVEKPTATASLHDEKHGAVEAR